MTDARAVSFRECCRRLDISERTGKRRLADGTFPIPELPRRAARGHHKFSTVVIDRYLAEESTADAIVQRRRLRVAS